MFYKHAIIFLRDSTLSLKYEYVLCTKWTRWGWRQEQEISGNTLCCTLYCIAFDHYSIQNKDIHQHKHSLLSILIIHEDFYNTILFSSKWRWCIFPYTAYIIRNSFLWNSNCVNFLLSMHIFFSLNPWSTSTKKMQMVFFSFFLCSICKWSFAFWWFSKCKTSKCSCTFDYIVVFYMNKI